MAEVNTHNMITEEVITELSKDQSEKFDGMFWKDIAKEIVEERGFTLVENAPKETLVEYRMTFMVGKGTFFTFKNGNESQLRHGFVYLRFEGDMRFIECKETN